MKMTSKRRRSKAQIKEDKRQEVLMKLQTQQKMARVDELQQQVATMEQQLNSSKQMQEEVQQMFDDGLLAGDPDNTFRVVDNPAEREQIRAVMSASKMKQQADSQQHS